MTGVDPACCKSALNDPTAPLPINRDNRAASGAIDVTAQKIWQIIGASYFLFPKQREQRFKVIRRARQPILELRFQPLVARTRLTDRRIRQAV